MTFLETLKNSIGGLLRLKSQLWWYNGVGWDNRPGRVCLILDATDPDACVSDASVQSDNGAWDEGFGRIVVSVLLFIDGSPKWVWVDEKNCELLTSEHSQ
jgi:hypothetical protein